VDASAGKIGTLTDQVLLFCYHYDPVTGKYGLLISRMVKLVGLLTVLGIALLILLLCRHEHYALPERRA
jgi:protein SCO1/2